MPLPNLLIIGVKKSGTTTLRHYMGNHPDIYIHPEELQFFNYNYDKGTDWYARQFESVPPDVKVIGEKSPSYYFWPAARDRIREAVPHARLVWIFRDPIDRAYSSYWHRYRRGVEPLTFREAIDAEPHRIEDDLFAGYVHASSYAHHVERFAEAFAMDGMAFVLLEELRKNPTEALRPVFEWLGVPAATLAERARNVNPTKLPRSVALQRFARRMGVRKSRLLNGVLMKLNSRTVPGYPPMDSDLREELTSHFRPLNERLAEMTGLDLGAWNR